MLYFFSKLILEFAFFVDIKSISLFGESNIKGGCLWQKLMIVAFSISKASASKFI